MRVVCGNCETPFVFKEYEETHAARSTWEGIVADLETAVQEADTENEAAIVDRDKARLEVGFVRRRLEYVKKRMTLADVIEAGGGTQEWNGVEGRGLFRRVQPVLQARFNGSGGVYRTICHVPLAEYLAAKPCAKLPVEIVDSAPFSATTTLSTSSFLPKQVMHLVSTAPTCNKPHAFAPLGFSLRGREQGKVPRGKARPRGQDGGAVGCAGAAENRAGGTERQDQRAAQDHPT